MTGSLRILLSNDDGIGARGLAVLEEVARGLSDDVWIVAPESEQSGAGHSLTINEPLRLRQVGERRYAVMGTPTDCVMLAVYYLMRGQRRPDLLLSGVNNGANLGEDVTYSGTVAAALEGALLGIRSIALSQVVRSFPGQTEPACWETAARHGAVVIDRLLRMDDWPNGVLMNVNFPDTGPNAVTGIHATVQGRRDTGDLVIDERADTRGVPYFWIGFRMTPGAPGSDTDFAAVARDRISVTPLRVHLTDPATLPRLRLALS